MRITPRCSIKFERSKYVLVRNVDNCMSAAPRFLSRVLLYSYRDKSIYEDYTRCSKEFEKRKCWSEMSSTAPAFPVGSLPRFICFWPRCSGHYSRFSRFPFSVLSLPPASSLKEGKRGLWLLASSSITGARDLWRL
jgi:hypothetical protein